ncbi:MAG: hypothetical protein LBC88_06645 [Spirochaetaceae bacterium]|jgi:hypothetical protein|nr:hypothetical protein [Spirochaetaceae bacterium]
MADRALVEKTLEKGEGIFRLNPNFIPRPFGKAGRRLRLHPDDYYAYGLERGSIKERWMTSTNVAQNGPLAGPEEGLSFVAVDYGSDEKFALRDAIQILGAALVGEELWSTYKGWPVFSKFYDLTTPLFHHLHLDMEAAARVGKLGKPECYYFPVQFASHTGEMNATYFGYDPDTTPEQVKQRLRDYNKGDNRITELSRAYRIELGTGWYSPAGVIHAPGSVMTFELNWNGDVNSVHENVVSGEIFDRSFLTGEVPDGKKDDIDYIFSLLDWEKNIDPHYKKHYSRRPITIASGDSHEEKWISYANDGYFSAKELTVFPGKRVTLTEPAAHGVILTEGHGRLGPHICESPTLLRFGRQSADEFYVSENAAKRGITIINESPVEPLVLLKSFGPNHPDAPKTVPQ